MSYDDSLPNDKDWIRREIGDINTSDEQLSDAEIWAVWKAQATTGEARRLYAAAKCLEMLFRKSLRAGDGLMEKEMPDVRLKWGGLDNKQEEMRRNILQLRRDAGDAFARGRSECGYFKAS